MESKHQRPDFNHIAVLQLVFTTNKEAMVDGSAIIAAIIAQENAAIWMRHDRAMQPTDIGAGGTKMAHGIATNSELGYDHRNDTPMICAAYGYQ